MTNAGTDYLFLSLDANGKTVGSTTCAGGCIYNYNITSGGATGTPADALQVAGGSGSIVIDNSGSATGESQVYYGSLSSQTCAGNGASSGTVRQRFRVVRSPGFAISPPIARFRARKSQNEEN